MWKGEIHCGGEKRLYKTTYFYYIANFPVGKSAMKKHSQFYGGKTTRGGGYSLTVGIIARQHFILVFSVSAPLPELWRNILCRVLKQ